MSLAESDCGDLECLTAIKAILLLERPLSVFGLVGKHGDIIWGWQITLLIYSKCCETKAQGGAGRCLHSLSTPPIK